MSATSVTFCEGEIFNGSTTRTDAEEAAAFAWRARHPKAPLTTGIRMMNNLMSALLLDDDLTQGMWSLVCVNQMIHIPVKSGDVYAQDG